MSLKDKKIIITRPIHLNDKLEQLIEGFHGQAITLAVSKVVIIKDFRKLDQKLNNLHDYSMLLITSQNALNVLMERLKKLKLAQPPSLMILAIGQSTKAACEKFGLNNILSCEGEASSSLFIDMLKARHLMSNQNVLYLQAKDGNNQLAKAFIENGSNVDKLDVYENQMNTAIKSRIKYIMNKGQADWLTFGSPFAFECFVKLAGGLNHVRRWINNEHIKIACIGPTTKSTLIQNGMFVSVCPKETNFESMVKDMQNHLS